MSDALPEIVAFLAWSSAELVVLAAVVWGIRRAARPGPAFTRRALALLVALPVLALGAWLLPTPAWVTVRTSLVAEAPATAHARASVPSADLAVHTATPEDARPSTVLASAPRAVSVDWRGMLAALWAAGVLVVLAVAGRRVLALRRLLRQTRRVSDARVRRLLVDAAATLEVRRLPRLRACDRPDAVPFLVGFGRPTIVVPSRLLAVGEHEALRFALLHELAHLRHRDHRWVLPELLLRAGYFFHPVVHHALSRLQEERECRADRVVARVSGRRAAYADFLLDEIETTRSRVPPAPALALGRGPGSMARRIHRLLDGRESTMKHSVRNAIAVALTTTVLLCLLGIAAGPLVADDVPAPPSADPRFGTINAVATNTEGVYRVYPVFEEVLGVHVVPQGGPYDAEHRRELTTGTDYTIDLAQGVLRFSVPVDPKTEFVSVRGYRVLPWQWIFGRPFAPDSVTVAFEDREGERGVDFEVDEAAGTIRFLKPELCHRKQQYSIVYRHPVDPAKPDVTPGGTIGTFVAPSRSRTVRTGQWPRTACSEGPRQGRRHQRDEDRRSADVDARAAA